MEHAVLPDTTKEEHQDPGHSLGSSDARRIQVRVDFLQEYFGLSDEKASERATEEAKYHLLDTNGVYNTNTACQIMTLLRTGTEFYLTPHGTDDAALERNELKIRTDCPVRCLEDMLLHHGGQQINLAGEGTYQHVRDRDETAGRSERREKDVQESPPPDACIADLTKLLQARAKEVQVAQSKYWAAFSLLLKAFNDTSTDVARTAEDSLYDVQQVLAETFTLTYQGGRQELGEALLLARTTFKRKAAEDDDLEPPPTSRLCQH